METTRKLPGTNRDKRLSDTDAEDRILKARAELKSVRTDIDILESEMQLIANRLRDTAAELDQDSIHRCHAANRLRKLAGQIAR